MVSEQESGAGELRDSGADSAGSKLREAREARRLDLAHIAAETRIPIRHLAAIEADQFEELPSRTYAIGFSRTYARVVGLDETMILDLVRADLAEGHGRRSAVTTGMEPGDPTKLPSRGLAWFGALAALVLAVGTIAYFNSYFGAGADPAPLVVEQEEEAAATDPAPAARESDPPAAANVPAAPQAGGPVVLTAIDDVWVRIYEDGGDRLLEKQLVRGESFTLPAGAEDPRINTARPDLLAITVGGTPVPNLADQAFLMRGQQISPEALSARSGERPAAVPDAN